MEKGRRFNITLHAEHCWVIRCTTPKGEVSYAGSPTMWYLSPAYSTIFRDHDEAWNAVKAFTSVLPSAKGTVYDVVPLYGALLKAGVK